MLNVSYSNVSLTVSQSRLEVILVSLQIRLWKRTLIIILDFTLIIHYTILTLFRQTIQGVSCHQPDVTQWFVYRKLHYKVTVYIYINQRRKSHVINPDYRNVMKFFKKLLLFSISTFFPGLGSILLQPIIIFANAPLFVCIKLCT